MSEFGTGFIDRDFDAEPFASVIPEYSGQTYPRDVWRDMISEQDKRKCSPYHAFKSASCPILSQSRTNYCWCFGLVQGVAVALAQSGYDESPPLHLSASYPAQLYKNYRNVGGWAMQAVQAVQKHGIPTVQVFPEALISRSQSNRSTVKKSAQKYGIAEYEEIPSRDFSTAFSALIAPDCSPVTLGLSWWGHLVLGIKGVYEEGKGYGILIVNSWGKNWSGDGTQVLWEKGSRNCIAQEYVAVKSAKVI